MTEQFLTIIQKENEQELISFLKSLTVDQKKKLIPQIKKLGKEYSQIGPLGNGTYGQMNGTAEQSRLVQMASFVCFNRADYDKSPYSIWMLEKERLSKIIDWYCPDWFSDFVNKQASLDNVPYYIHYDWIMELTVKGFLTPSKELLVKVMPQTIYELGKDRLYHYKPENLLKFSVTLKEHIWYLFEVESNLHSSDRFINFTPDTSKDKKGWMVLFKKHSDENVIDRSRLLKESLLASNRNFNKVLSGWFSELFTELVPAKEEMLTLQHELFSVLNSPHSKPVNTALQAIRIIVTEKEFNAGGFLDAVPVLLSSGVKSTLLSSLIILEKLAEKESKYSSRIVSLTCQCFIQPHEDVQTKAAKLIAKFGDASNDALRNEIMAFYPGMLTTARQALAGFYNVGDKAEIIEPDEKQLVEPVAPLSDQAAIPFPSNIDDLIFLASQAFDNNEPWHIDVLPAALVQFSSHLKEQDIPLFAPAFQRAFGLIKNSFRSTTGSLDYLLATFFIDFGNWLIKNFQLASESIVQVYRKHDTKEGDRNTTFLVSPASGSYTARWNSSDKLDLYEPYKQLLLENLERIRKGSDLPVLSTPTHAPCWISADVLTDRLRQYQQAGQEPDNIDLQVALSRVALDNNTVALKQVNEQLSGEFGALMNFLLNEEAAPKKPFYHKAAWMVASLTKKEKKAWPEFESFSYYKRSLKNYTGQLHWESIVESYTSSRYDYELKKRVEELATRKILSVHSDDTKSEKSGLKKVFSMLLSETKDDPPMLYEFLHFNQGYLMMEHNDAKRTLSLIPNNPEPILADTINKYLQYPEFWEEGNKKMVIAVLQFLYDTWKTPGNMAHLFLGTCMLNADKTVVNIAGEIWLKGVSTNTINNVELGKVIGLHERIEFAPLKRFTDLAGQNLFRVSNMHNRQLQVLVENILSHLPDEPIKNLKKLLEILRELVTINNSLVEKPETVNKLAVWEGTTGLKKIVEQINKGGTQSLP